MRASIRERRPARSGRSLERSHSSSGRDPHLRIPGRPTRDLARLAARVAYLEEILGLAEEPVRVIRIG